VCRLVEVAFFFSLSLFVVVRGVHCGLCGMAVLYITVIRSKLGSEFEHRLLRLSNEMLWSQGIMCSWKGIIDRGFGLGNR